MDIPEVRRIDRILGHIVTPTLRTHLEQVRRLSLDNDSRLLRDASKAGADGNTDTD